MNRVHPTLIIAAVLLVPAVFAFILSGKPVILVALMIGVAMFVNGVIATIEDDLPRGFNNPDGDRTPRYIRLVGIFGRVFIAVAAIFSLAVIFLNYQSLHAG